ncbi:MAG: energy-coupling factor ABC transporter permease [Pseudomonadota bacterium]
MNLPAHIFSRDVLWLGNVIYFVWLGRAIWRADWRELWHCGTRFNALIALSLGIFAFWQLSAGIRPGFSFHLIGSTLFVLMFGWRIAAATLTLIMLVTWLRTGADFVSLGLNGLTMILVPVVVTEALLRFSKANLPKNLFMFVLLNGFFCGGAAIALNVMVTTVLFLLFTGYTWPMLQYYYLVASPILAFAEAFATGVMITAFVVAQPDAVKNFSVEEYLDGK